MADNLMTCKAIIKLLGLDKCIDKFETALIHTKFR